MISLSSDFWISSFSYREHWITSVRACVLNDVPVLPIFRLVFLSVGISEA